MLQFPDIVFSPIEFLASGEAIFLVGGAIRDSLLNVTVKDIDYAVTVDPQGIARKFAEKHAGAFYVLDQERNSYRVLLNQASTKRMVFDFIQMRGNTIQDDLLERDFTINAMAVDLSRPGEIIDPLKGGRDLLDKRLKPVRESSIIDDPVRVIRAVRYAVDLGLSIDRETLLLIDQAVGCLDVISVERKRDELFKILAGKNIGTAMLLLKRFGIFSTLRLEVNDDLDFTARTLKSLDQCISIVCGKTDPQKSPAFLTTSLLLKFGRLSERLAEHFFDLDPSGRMRKSLTLFAGLFEANSDRILKDMLAKFALSTGEITTVGKIVSGRQKTETFLAQPGGIPNRDVYKFFKEEGEVGIDLVIFALSFVFSKALDGHTQFTWLGMLDNADKCLESWFEHPEIVNPKPLLNGKDLMFQFDLPPGPLVGDLLEGMKEEQASGEINTKVQALDWVEKKLLRLN